MLENYIKIALRNLARRRFNALVTLLGLTVGIIPQKYRLG